MRLSPAGEALIKSFEKLKLLAYQDERGIWTVGWGHTGAEVRQGVTVTVDTAENLFIQDTIDALNTVVKSVDVALSQNQLDALTSFVFNLGAGDFRGSTLLKLLNAGQPPATVAAEFLRWDHVRVDGVLLESAGLKARRKAEHDLFLAA